jgi:hypothetical protein
VRKNCRHVVSMCRDGAGGYLSLSEDPADRRNAEAVAKCEGFSLDSLVTPGCVLLGHSFDQCGGSVVDGRAPGSVRIGPLFGNQTTVPAQDGAGYNQAVSAECLGQQSDVCGQDCPVGPVQPRFPGRSAKHGDLVAQDEQLHVLGSR